MEFLRWAEHRTHPSADPLPPLPSDLEAAIEHTWMWGTGITADRHGRMAMFRKISHDLEPLSARMALRVCDNAKIIGRAMALNILRRSDPHATLDDIGDDMVLPHFALIACMLDAMH